MLTPLKGRINQGLQGRFAARGRGCGVPSGHAQPGRGWSGKAADCQFDSYFPYHCDGSGLECRLHVGARPSLAGNKSSSRPASRLTSPFFYQTGASRHGFPLGDALAANAAGSAATADCARGHNEKRTVDRPVRGDLDEEFLDTV